MKAEDRYWRVMQAGGVFRPDSWEILVKKALEVEEQENQQIQDSVFAEQPVNLPKDPLVRLYPGMMVVRGRDIVGADAEIARVQMELDEIRELAEQDINESRRARLMATIERVRRAIAARGVS